MSLKLISEQLATAGVKYRIVTAKTTKDEGTLAVEALYRDFASILDGYLEAALWSTNYSGEDPDIDEEEDSDRSFQDLGYDSNTISKDFQKSAKTDIDSFLKQVKRSVSARAEIAEYADEARQVGHYLWLSRNGHGAGFFDRNHRELQKLAKGMRSVDLFANANGMICES